MRFAISTAKGTCRATSAALFATLALWTPGCGRSGSVDLHPPPDPSPAADSPAPPIVELSTEQLNAIKIGKVGTYAFAVKKTGIGSIDFENNIYSDAGLSTPVFPPVAGVIGKIFVELGDQVQKDEPLYSFQPSGTNQAEIIVRSPIAGQIASVNATPELSVSPAGTPGPVAVADVSKKWLLANVPEADALSYQIGQPVQVAVASFPGRTFDGNISKINPAVDTTMHRLTLRADISDPANELRAGMLADFSAEVKPPVEAVALSENGVVREGDGTLTAWVTTDQKHFHQRIVKTGLRENGEVQILDGLTAGEWAVTDGAIFLDNMLQAPPGD